MLFTKLTVFFLSFAIATAMTGDLTYYATGLGACGTFSAESDYVCAIGHAMFSAATASAGGNSNNNPYCGKQIRATLSQTGKTVVVTVMDSCSGCADEDLDFSGGAWEDITGGAEPTRFEGLEWEWI